MIILRHAIFTLAGLLALPALPSVQGATIVVNHVYDPNNVIPVSLSGEPLLTPVTLGVGDTLDLTITFKDGKIANFVGESGLWPLLLTVSGDAVLETSGTLQFLNPSSNLNPGPIPLDQLNLYVHIGSFYSASLYRTDSNPISFSGLRQIITINNILSGVDPREYRTVVLTFFDGQVYFTAIPEPSSCVLAFTAAAVLAGLRVRRFAL